MEFLKKPVDATNYEHCIVKEELMISDIDEDVDNEVIDQIPTNGGFSLRSGRLNIKNFIGDKKVQSTLDAFIKLENIESNNVKSENLDDVAAESNAAIEISKPNLDKLTKKLAKSYCKKCKIERIVIRRRARCFGCQTQLSYTCKNCETTYTNFTDLHYHIRDKHSPQPPCHPCPQCPRTFNYKKGLLRHRRTFHPADLSLADKCSKSKCEKQLKKTTNHKRQHEKVGGDEATFQCSKCPFKARYKSNLTSHMGDKHSDFEAECRQCGKVFTNKRSMARHEKVYCNKSKSIECDHCGHRVFRKDQMRRHIEQLHPNVYAKSDKMVKDLTRTCEHCGLTLKRYAQMRFHVERCPKVRRPSKAVVQPNIAAALKKMCKALCFKCNTKGPVKNRVRRCDECKRLLKFSCETCSKVFGNSYALREHLQTKHMEKQVFYRCDQCPSSYNRRKNLWMHKKVCHSSERATITNYTCPKCDKLYRNKQSFRRHATSCGQEPKYHCDKCSYSSHFKSNMVDHFRSKRATCI